MKLLWKSLELRDYDVEHLCTVLESDIDGRTWVALKPPIPGFLYGESGEIERIALSPRYTGSSIVPLTESPLTVNVWLRRPESAGDGFRLADIAKVREC